MQQKATSRFRVNDAQTDAIANLKAGAEFFEQVIEETRRLDVEGKRAREFSLALTKLEECLMWAKKGVTG